MIRELNRLILRAIASVFKGIWWVGTNIDEDIWMCIGMFLILISLMGMCL